ncbi:MAG: rRNA maturation RNase YbeY [Puniceicoccales bacterium]|jgi:probable rRNA maturation factor|nr:rRNA maturation RNase YbeY [Puniceicoccales bacterium]
MSGRTDDIILRHIRYFRKKVNTRTQENAFPLNYVDLEDSGITIPPVEYFCYNEHPDFQLDEANVETVLSAIQTYMPLDHYDVISVAFLNESTLVDLHMQFLNDPTPTDVMTFPANEGDDERVGEICISVDQAQKYATEHRQDLAWELTLYLVHGWLHLCGYNDLKIGDRRAMRAAEQAVLSFLKEHYLKLEIKYGKWSMPACLL